MWPFNIREKRDFELLRTERDDARDRVKELAVFYSSQSDETRRLRHENSNLRSIMAAVVWNANESHSVKVPLVDTKRKIILMIGGDMRTNEQIYSAYDPNDEHNAR
jgi:hypothetical protein